MKNKSFVRQLLAVFAELLCCDRNGLPYTHTHVSARKKLTLVARATNKTDNADFVVFSLLRRHRHTARTNNSYDASD